MIVTAQPIRHCERSFDFAQDKTSRSNLGRALRLRLALRPFGAGQALRLLRREERSSQ